MCPTCSVPLDRQDDYGLCHCCGFGWSANTDSVTLHFDVSLDVWPSRIAK